MRPTKPSGVPDLTGFGTAEARWARLGPYYAMFPVEFAREVIGTFSRAGDTVLDPFCGRGTAPYISMIAGRRAAGCDINPVAWLYAAAKTRPHQSLEDVNQRINEINSSATSRDRRPENEFQSLAFAPRALGFINAARRELRWRDCILDRTVASLMVHYLHAKLGQGLSNQMRPAKATSPNYSVRWWKKRGFTNPPDIDPSLFLAQRATWRYAKGMPCFAGNAWVALGDATDALEQMPATADLVFTSPPYVDVTNYRVDNWLRLWALGEGPALPDWSSAEKYASPTKYETMLTGVLEATRKRAHENTVWWLRVDARQRTLSVARRVLGALLPKHHPYQRYSASPKRTQTSLYGDHGTKPGDIDLVYLPPALSKPGTLRTIHLDFAA